MKRSFPVFFSFAPLSLFLVAFLAINLVTAQSKKAANPVNGYGKATYSLTSSGQFMRDWLIAGPNLVNKDGVSTPDDLTQHNSFNEDDGLSIVVDVRKPLSPIQKNGTSLTWNPVSSSNDIIDLDALYQNKNFASAYAMAEIKSDVEQKILFAFGSDDGIKVILNGKVIHNNWIPRGTTPDEDVVPATLVKGSNQLIIKVQDMQGGWGFTSKILNKQSVSDKLIVAAGKGALDEVALLLGSGAEVDRKNGAGLTAVAAAKMNGRAEVVKILMEKGAADSAVPSPSALVDNEYAWLKGKKSAGIAVLVGKDGRIIYEKGFGHANISTGQLITPTTRFRIGSITKQFIGAAILKLQEEGKLSVQDKLSKYIPDFPRGEEVTIHHLLTHTSGIHSYTSKNDFISNVTSPITENDLVNLIKKEPYDFNPGERFLYNNSGYFLLGHIVRKVTGKFYSDYFREQFFMRLGMTNTGAYDNSVKLENEAVGYKKENDQYKADINWDMSWAGGAGALYSTAEDLFKWNEGLFNGKILRPESLKTAFTSVILNNGQPPVEAKYGYGWFLGEHRGLETIEHGGGLHGFSTRIARYLKENLTVVLLTNVIPEEATLSTHMIAQYFVWDKMKPQESHSVNKEVVEDLKPYEGRYDFGNGMVMTVSSQGNNLSAQITGQPSFPLFASAPGEYFWKVVEAKVKFIRNEKGEVIHGEFSQGSVNVNIIRLQEVPIVAVDPGLFDFYIGKYDLGDDQVTVSKENDKLFAQTNTSPRFEFKPLSEKEFAILEINAKVTFIRDGNEKANKLILDMAGQRKEVPRIE